ncbi:MAG: hypothetical protein WD278_01950 [Pirellulales bacterium]
MPNPLGDEKRKVQPKLRMIADCSAEVNAVRAELSASITVEPGVADGLPVLRGMEPVTVTQSLVAPPPPPKLLKMAEGVRVNVFVEEGKKTLLLTGDGHAGDILKGLEFHGKTDGQGRMHVDALKMQHHGSEHNIDEEFVKRVTADHYIFCGNGKHENPDLRVIALILDSRLAGVPFAATHPKAAGAFRFWFNSSDSATENSAAKEHMKELQKQLSDRKKQSDGRFSFELLKGDTPSFDLSIA